MLVGLQRSTVPKDDSAVAPRPFLHLLRVEVPAKEGDECSGRFCASCELAPDLQVWMQMFLEVAPKLCDGCQCSFSTAFWGGVCFASWRPNSAEPSYTEQLARLARTSPLREVSLMRLKSLAARPIRKSWPSQFPGGETTAIGWDETQ